MKQGNITNINGILVSKIGAGVGTHKWQFVVGKPPIWRSEFMILSRSQYLDPCLAIFKGERTIRHQLLP
jgi:hypothetical protein